MSSRVNPLYSESTSSMLAPFAMRLRMWSNRETGPFDDRLSCHDLWIKDNSRQQLRMFHNCLTCKGIIPLAQRRVHTACTAVPITILTDIVCPFRALRVLPGSDSRDLPTGRSFRAAKTPSWHASCYACRDRRHRPRVPRRSNMSRLPRVLYADRTAHCCVKAWKKG